MRAFSALILISTLASCTVQSDRVSLSAMPTGAGQSSITAPPDEVDRMIEAIDASIPHLRLERKTVKGLALQPAQFEGYFDGAVLKRLDVRFIAPGGTRTTRYYFDSKGQMIHVLTGTSGGNLITSHEFDVVDKHATGVDAEDVQTLWLIEDGEYYATLMGRPGATITATPINRE